MSTERGRETKDMTRYTVIALAALTAGALIVGCDDTSSTKTQTTSSDGTRTTTETRTTTDNDTARTAGDKVGSATDHAVDATKRGMDKLGTAAEHAAEKT